MANQDFTSGYTEVDSSGNDLTVTASKVDVSSMDVGYSGGGAMVFKDFGGNIFTDYTHLYEFYANSASGAGSRMEMMMVGDEANEAFNLQANMFATEVYMNGSQAEFGIYKRVNNGLSFGSGAVNVNKDTLYYAKNVRVNSTVTATVYPTATDRTNDTNAVGSCNVTGVSAGLRYFYPVSSYRESSPSSTFFTGYVQNVDLNLPDYTLLSSAVTISPSVSTTQLYAWTPSVAEPVTITASIGETCWADELPYSRIAEGVAIIEEGGAGAWDESIRCEIGNILDVPDNPIGGRWLGIYCGFQGAYVEGQTKIGLYYSDDKITWTKYSGNPINGGAYMEDPHWFLGSDGKYYIAGEDAPNENVILWSTEDFATITDHGIMLAPSQPWETFEIWEWIGSPTWYPDDANNMLYLLYEGAQDGGALGLASIPLSDFFSHPTTGWTKFADNPIMTHADIDWDLWYGALAPDSIVKTGNTYFLTYHTTHETWNTINGVMRSGNLRRWHDSTYSPLNNSRTTMYVDFDNNELISTPFDGSNHGSIMWAQGANDTTAQIAMAHYRRRRS